MRRFLWLAAGASLGAALAMLFAPQSGKQTRRYIGRQARRGRQALAEAGRGAFDAGRQWWEQGRALAEEVATEFVDRGQQLLES